MFENVFAPESNIVYSVVPTTWYPLASQIRGARVERVLEALEAQKWKNTKDNEA